MKHHVRRADADALVDGTPLDDAHGLDDVQDFFARMRTDFAASPAPEPRPVLASILDGRRPLRTADTFDAAPTAAPRPASILSRNRWPRPVAAVLATGTLMFSGLAVAGALPAPVQRVSADVGASLGFDLPRPTDSPTPARISPSSSRNGSTNTPNRGAGRTGQDETKLPAVDPAVPTPSVTIPGVGATGATPTVPTTPSLTTPLPLPDPTLAGLLPSVTTLPLPLSLDPAGLLRDVPRTRVVPSP